MKFHHIGIATEDIKETIKELKQFFSIKEISKIVYDANQNANLCMLTLEDGVMIELISGDVVANLVRKKQYLYHTCYSVENIEKTIEQLLQSGAFLVKEPKEAILFNNQKVAFLMWKLGLIELVENSNCPSSITFNSFTNNQSHEEN